MNKKGTVVILAGVFALLIAGSVVLYNWLSPQVEPESPLSPALPQSEPAQPGTPESSAAEPVKLLAPDFTVTDRQGNTVSLAEFQGTPVVLNFWASWCGPCQSEMPEFDRLSGELEGEVAFLMVNLTDGFQETQELATAFVDELGYTFPVYFDLEQEGATAYGVTSIPTTYFIDREGYAVSRALGALTEERLRNGIDMIIHEG